MMTTFMVILCLLYFTAFALRVFLAVNHPAAYEALEKVEDRRREGNRNRMLGAAKAGFAAYRMLRR